MASTTRQKIRVPSQKRGQVALDTLLDVGEELLAKDGFEGFTMSELSRRTGVSNGAMYWRFENKEALVYAVLERYNGRWETHLDRLRDTSRWEGRPLDEVVAGAAREIAAVFLIDAPLMRALCLAAGHVPGISDAAAQNIAQTQDVFCAMLEPHLVSAGHPAPHQAAADVFEVIQAAMGGRITWPEYFVAGAELDRFADRICAMAATAVEADIAAVSA